MASRFNFEYLIGKLDIFALIPTLRTSPKSDKLGTPPGIIATLALLIMCILFI